MVRFHTGPGYDLVRLLTQLVIFPQRLTKKLADGGRKAGQSWTSGGQRSPFPYARLQLPSP